MVPLLNTELVLEAPVEVADGGGGVAVEWEALGTIWAEIAVIRGREDVVGGRGPRASPIGSSCGMRPRTARAGRAPNAG